MPSISGARSPSTILANDGDSDDSHDVNKKTNSNADMCGKDDGSSSDDEDDYHDEEEDDKNPDRQSFRVRQRSTMRKRLSVTGAMMNNMTIVDDKKLEKLLDQYEFENLPNSTFGYAIVTLMLPLRRGGSKVSSLNPSTPQPIFLKFKSIPNRIIIPRTTSLTTRT